MITLNYFTNPNIIIKQNVGRPKREACYENILVSSSDMYFIRFAVCLFLISFSLLEHYDRKYLDPQFSLPMRYLTG